MDLLRINEENSNPGTTLTSRSKSDLITVLQREVLRLNQFILEILPDSANPREDPVKIYQEQELKLYEVIKSLLEKIEGLEEENGTQRDLIKGHESEIQEVRREYEIRIARVVKENAELIEEIMDVKIQDVQEWRAEYERELARLEGSVDKKEERTKALKLYEEFKGLSPVTQGIIVAGVCISTAVLGYFGGPFIIWVWPKLVAFASQRAVIAAVGSWMYQFSQSRHFNELIQAWAKGEPFLPNLCKALREEFNDNLKSIAPMLFKGAKEQ